MDVRKKTIIPETKEHVPRKIDFRKQTNTDNSKLKQEQESKIDSEPEPEPDYSKWEPKSLFEFDLKPWNEE